MIKKSILVLRFEGDKRVKRVILSDGSKMDIDFVLFVVGVRFFIQFLEGSGIQFLLNGVIKVDEYMRINIEGIFVVGDCVLVYFKLNGKIMYVLLGFIVNKMGRIVGENVIGGSMKFSGILVILIFKVFDFIVV